VVVVERIAAQLEMVASGLQDKEIMAVLEAHRQYIEVVAAAAQVQ
jgi:hypothetical protein